MFRTIFIALLAISTISICSADDDFPFLKRPKTSSGQDEAKAAWNIIDRLIPNDSQRFKTFLLNDITLDGDIFTIIKKDDNIEIRGSSGVAIAWGFHYYLKNFCNSHIGWQVQRVDLPNPLPEVNVTIRAQTRLRYYQNVCTTSYSFVWWTEKEWRRHVDWMAMNGVNVALAPHGQEAIWLRVYQKLKLTKDEISEHFAGPAFLSWQRMGNIRGWGGPLSAAWHEHSLRLQKFLVQAMSELGMVPALPAFAGFVPSGLKRIYPDAKMLPTQQWNSFEPKYCCPLFLDPTDPLFESIGKMFLTELTSEFGSTHLYYSDPFNEIKPTSDNEDFLKDVGKAILKTMTDIDKDAVWLLQNWMFVHDSSYWTESRVKAFLTSVPQHRIIILDLQSEQWPQYEKHSMYHGRPFVWCMLHNFGGTLGMFGDSHSVNNEVYRAMRLPNSTMVGVGITPEGINQNFVMYELLWDSALRSETQNLTEWSAKYAQRRYGEEDENISEAWDILMKTIYNFRGLNKMRGKYVVTRRPSTTIKPWAWYSDKDLSDVLKLFLSSKKHFASSDGYKHDLVDLTRQLLQYRADQLYVSLVEYYNKKDLNNFRICSKYFLNVFDDLEKILSSHEHFLLSNWLESAKNVAETNEDRKLFEYNARNQITLWGPNGEIFDYANKQWAGLISDYYKPRWNLFIQELEKSLMENRRIDMNVVKQKMFKNVEEAFTLSNKDYSLNATGDSISIAQEIFDKWKGSEYSKISLKSIYLVQSMGNSNFNQRPRREFHEIDEDYVEDDFDIFPNVIQLKDV